VCTHIPLDVHIDLRNLHKSRSSAANTRMRRLTALQQHPQQPVSPLSRRSVSGDFIQLTVDAADTCCGWCA
jgi:hypothetical protein